MALIYDELFEVGPDGAAITSSNSVFNQPSGLMEFDAGISAIPQGAWVCRLPGGGASLLRYDGAALVSSGHRTYARIAAAPSANTEIFAAWTGPNTTSRWDIRVTTGMLVQIRITSIAVSTTSWTVPTDTWFRLEARVDSTPSSGSHVVELQLFTGDNIHGTTPDQTHSFTTGSIAGSWESTRTGRINAQAADWYFDGIAAADSAEWIGPLSQPVGMDSYDLWAGAGPYANQRRARLAPELATSFAATEAYSALVQQDAPVRYYRLGDASGTAIREEIVGAHGYLTAAGVTAGQASLVEGVADTSIRFNTAGFYTLPPVDLVNRSFTIECWLKLPAAPASSGMIFGHHTSASTGQSLHLRVRSTGVVEFNYFSDDLVTSAGALTLDAIHHLVFVYDALVDTSIIYIDSVEAASGGQGPYNGSPTSTVVQLGAWQSTEPLDALLDEFAIYDYALTVGQVDAHYDLGKAPVTSTNAPAQTASFTVTADNAQASVATSAAEATVSFVAHDAAVTTAVSAPAQTASFTVAGQDATSTVSTEAGTASVVLSAHDPSASVATPAETATLVLAASDATVTTSGGTSAAAETASVALAAHDATTTVATSAPAAEFTLAGQDASVTTSVQAAAQTATFTLAAQDAQPSVRASAAEATITFVAHDATVSTATLVSAFAETASITLAAQDATTAVAAPATTATLSLVSSNATTAVSSPAAEAPLALAALDATVAVSSSGAASAETAAFGFAALDASILAGVTLADLVVAAGALRLLVAAAGSTESVVAAQGAWQTAYAMALARGTLQAAVAAQGRTQGAVAAGGNLQEVVAGEGAL